MVEERKTCEDVGYTCAVQIHRDFEARLFCPTLGRRNPTRASYSSGSRPASQNALATIGASCLPSLYLLHVLQFTALRIADHELPITFIQDIP